MRIGTHTGRFHCDDVLACYMVKRLKEFKDAPIHRTRDPSILKSCDIVFDVGLIFNHSKKLYDHHQNSFTETLSTISNGKYDFDIKLSSTGLVYYFYGKRIIREFDSSLSENQVEDIFSKFYETFIMEIDAIDNGSPICDCSEFKYYQHSDLSSRVELFNRPWYEETPENDDQIDYFMNAMKMVGDEFNSRLTYCIRSTTWMFDLVSQAFRSRHVVHSSGRIMYFDNYCPFDSELKKLEKMNNIEGHVLYVITRNLRESSYSVKAVANKSKFDLRNPLKEDFRGLRDHELVSQSGLDLIFVHSTGFIGAAGTYEDALQLAVVSMF